MDTNEELLRIEREKRNFTILQRERESTEVGRNRNRAAVMAGVCILGAAVSFYFNGQDPKEIIQHELAAIYSWEALGQYFKDMGPVTTLFALGAASFLARYQSLTRRFRDIRHQWEDFGAAVASASVEELGGSEDARTR